MEITTGIALTYDILYDQLTEAERGELRAALKTSADFIHDRFFVDQYWTGDFQNNHMHHRINGLAHAAFALHGDDPAIDVQKHADLALWAVQQVADWLPPDGSTHEGPGYWSYGHHWVVHAMYLAEHVTGVDPTTANPHFASDHYFRIYLTAPGWQRTFGIADSGVPPWDGGWPDLDGGGAGDGGGATGDGGAEADGGGGGAAGLSGSCGCAAGRGPAGALALLAFVLLRRRSVGGRPRG